MDLDKETEDIFTKFNDEMRKRGLTFITIIHDGENLFQQMKGQRNGLSFLLVNALTELRKHD